MLWYRRHTIVALANGRHEVIEEDTNARAKRVQWVVAIIPRDVTRQSNPQDVSMCPRSKKKVGRAGGDHIQVKRTGGDQILPVGELFIVIKQVFYIGDQLVKSLQDDGTLRRWAGIKITSL